MTYAWCAQKMRRKKFRSQKASLVEVSKKPFLTSEIDSWLLRSFSFWKSIKLTLNCHKITLVPRVLLLFIPKAFLGSTKRFKYSLYIQYSKKCLGNILRDNIQTTLIFRNWNSEETKSQFHLSKKVFLKPRPGLRSGS